MTNTTNENRKYLEAVAQEIKEAYNNGNMIDYVCDNVLDVEYILNSLRELIGVKLFITLGGPTIWIDTRDYTLNISWGSERDQIGVFSEICEELNCYFEEDFNI